VEAKKILAEADHEKIRIDSEAAGQAPRASRTRPSAEDSRTYAAASGKIQDSTNSLRTLQAYDKFLDDKTTLFLPADAGRFCGCCTSTRNRSRSRPSPPPPGAISDRRRSTPEQKTRGGGPVTFAYDQGLGGDARREADHAKDRYARRRPAVASGTWRACGLAIAIGSLVFLGPFSWSPSGLGILRRRGGRSARGTPVRYRGGGGRPRHA